MQIKPKMRYPFIPTKLAKIKKTTKTNVGKDVEHFYRSTE